jgi:hypothetical protein
MANPASVAGVGFSGTVRNTFPVQTVAATAETILTVNTDTGTTPFFLVAPSGGKVYGATSGLDINANQAITQRGQEIYGVPSGESNDQFNTSSWSGREFKVRLTGTGNAGANGAQSLVFNLYQGTSTTLGSNKLLGTTGAAFAAVAGGGFNFSIEATLLWDATSQILSGSYTSNIAFGSVSQFTIPTVVSNVVTGVTAANLSFLATVTLGNAASSTVSVQEFVLDRV